MWTPHIFQTFQTKYLLLLKAMRWWYWAYSCMWESRQRPTYWFRTLQSPTSSCLLSRSQCRWGSGGNAPFCYKILHVRYIISHPITSHHPIPFHPIPSHHIMYRIIYHIIYHIRCEIIYHIISYITSHHISYHITSHHIIYTRYYIIYSTLYMMWFTTVMWCHCKRLCGMVCYVICVTIVTCHKSGKTFVSLKMYSPTYRWNEHFYHYPAMKIDTWAPFTYIDLPGIHSHVKDKTVARSSYL